MNKNNLSKNLYELRCINHLSQEEMAEKLLVSRQAISKWERGEAYPDTENLIIISNTFDVTLDELVKGDLSEKPPLKEQIQEEAANESCEEAMDSSDNGGKTDFDEEYIPHVTVEDDYVSIYDEEANVHVSIEGGRIKVRDKQKDVSVNLSIPGFKLISRHLDKENIKKDNIYVNILPYPIVATLAFLLIGILADGFYWSWTLFLTVPVYYSLVDAVRQRRFSEFAYPVLTAFLFCLFGMLYGVWHPSWLIFLTVPVYEALAAAIDHRIHR